MTVEEARAALEWEMQGRDCGPMLDRLILAVKAEMSCYRAWWDDNLTLACTIHLHANPERWCPSCTARKEMAG